MDCLAIGVHGNSFLSTCRLFTWGSNQVASISNLWIFKNTCAQEAFIKQPVEDAFDNLSERPQSRLPLNVLLSVWYCLYYWVI